MALAPPLTLQADASTGRYATVALVDARVDSADEDLTQLCWGGGPHALLAAASSGRVHIFSLAVMLARLESARRRPSIGSASGAAAAALQAPPAVASGDGAAVLVGTHRLPAVLSGLAWTQDGGGLLVADAAGNVSMLAVACAAASSAGGSSGGHGEPPASPSAAASSSAIGHLWTARSDACQVRCCAMSPATYMCLDRCYQLMR